MEANFGRAHQEKVAHGFLDVTLVAVTGNEDKIA